MPSTSAFARFSRCPKIKRLGDQQYKLIVQTCDEPGSSIMPGKVNPTQCEALAMIAVQVMADDVAAGFGGAGGYREMNVHKPLMIFNVTHSIAIMSDGCPNFRKFLVEGTKPNLKKINEYVERSLMLVTALLPVIGYDKASKIAHCAQRHDGSDRGADPCWPEWRWCTVGNF
jgi:fumarate hydratase class II